MLCRFAAAQTARREAPADTAEALTALAARIDEQLADETANRQAIAEEASARIKGIARQLPRREAPPTVQEMREIFFPEDPEGLQLPGAGEGDVR